VGLRLVSYLKSGARSPVSLERGADSSRLHRMDLNSTFPIVSVFGYYFIGEIALFDSVFSRIFFSVKIRRYFFDSSSLSMTKVLRRDESFCGLTTSSNYGKKMAKILANPIEALPVAGAIALLFFTKEGREFESYVF
ncbi:hypothetical protein, partial [Phormidium sp. CCY1219]|uniref:hypothetical protein n=1 Tax=Phormidium sp. CCY1219 TaxID=2886104 RepID=UPI002D1F5148